jgi:hypothetical protein
VMVMVMVMVMAVFGQAWLTRSEAEC